jgi:hypothetical protein
MPDTAFPSLPRRMALVVLPQPGESLISWVDAVAADLGITRSRAAAVTGVLEPPENWLSLSSNRSPVYAMSQVTVERIGAATDLSAEQARDLTWLRFCGTALPAVTPGPADGPLTLKKWLGRHGVSPERRRACPRCLAENGGRWPLSWSLPWHVLCLRHRCYLIDRCPACGQALRADALGGVCGLRPAPPARSLARCGTVFAEIGTRPVHDHRLFEFQQHLLGLLDAAPGRRVEARAVFSDMWPMTHLAMFTAAPEHLDGADDAVRDAFARFNNRVTSRWAFPSPIERRSPPVLVAAAVLRLAADIVFAPDPFKAADAICGLARPRRPEGFKRLQRAWQTFPLGQATDGTTDRLNDVMTAALSSVASRPSRLPRAVEESA